LKISARRAVVPAVNDLDRRLAALPPEKRALLVQRLAERGSPVRGTESIPRRVATDGRSPVSSSQHRLWFLNQLEQGNPAYNVYRAVRMRGDLSPEALAKSLSEIVRRHSILRTTFPAPDGWPVQLVQLDWAVPLPIVDLSELPAEKHELEVARRAFAESHRRFDLERGPMIRTTLLRLGLREHVLLLTCHHIVADGWSVGILFRELAVLYEAFSKGLPSPLDELPIQYSDYAAWQQEWLESNSYREQLAYWKHQLAAAPTQLDLPTDRPRTALKSTRGERHFLAFPRSLFDGLIAVSRQVTATPFMGLLAGFKALLHRYSGQSVISIGSPAAGRNQHETQSLVGCFSNTLVLCTRLPENATFRQLLLAVKETALGAYDHADMPFERLVRELKPRRDPSRMTFFQVNFRLLTAPPPPSKLGPLDLEFLRVDNRRVKFDLSVEFWEKPDALHGYFEYYTDLFDRSTISTIIDDFAAMIGACTAQPDVPMGSLQVPIRLRQAASIASLSTNQSEDTMTRPLRAAERKPVPLSSDPTLESTDSGSPKAQGAAPIAYRVRQATLRDADFLYRLRKETMTHYVSEFEGWTEAHREAFYMDFDPATHSIIVVDGRDVGAMCLLPGEHEIYFANLHIITELQGRGLGTKVFQDVFAEADAQGKPIVAQALKNNRSWPLYRRLGFVVTWEDEIRYGIKRPTPETIEPSGQPPEERDRG
jgi:ribosomal protein S18 acetylase RimI-like enzyme